MAGAGGECDAEGGGVARAAGARAVARRGEGDPGAGEVVSSRALRTGPAWLLHYQERRSEPRPDRVCGREERMGFLLANGATWLIVAGLLMLVAYTVLTRMD